MAVSCKGFRHSVWEHLRCIYQLEPDLFAFDTFSNKMVLNIDVLRSYMIFLVLSESDRTLIVPAYESCVVNRCVARNGEWSDLER